MCIVFFLGAWHIFVKLFIYHLTWNGTQFFVQPISFSPFSVIGLHYCSVDEIIDFVIGLLISVASPKLPSHHHYHLAEIMVTSFANLCPHSKLFNLFLVKRAYEPHQNKEIFELKEKWKTKTSPLSSQKMDISTYARWAIDWRCNEESTARTPALQNLTI